MSTESLEIPNEDEEQAQQAPYRPTLLDSGQIIDPPFEISTSQPAVTSPSAITTLSGMKSDGDFLGWAIDSSIAFLDLADLPPLQTVDGLRGLKEHQIRDKVQIANSVLVLVANYASKADNKELVKECEVYADKMKTIIKRLCL